MGADVNNIIAQTFFRCSGAARSVYTETGEGLKDIAFVNLFLCVLQFSWGTPPGRWSTLQAELYNGIHINRSENMCAQQMLGFDVIENITVDIRIFRRCE